MKKENELQTGIIIVLCLIAMMFAGCSNVRGCNGYSWKEARREMLR